MEKKNQIWSLLMACWAVNYVETVVEVTELTLSTDPDPDSGDFVKQPQNVLTTHFLYTGINMA